MVENTHFIAVKKLSKVYQGAGRAAASSISFTLDPGEVLGILGPNGAGKTTTIKMVLGLVTPSSGQAAILGHNTAIESQRLVANPHVGVVLEGARNVYWRLSPLENLRYFGANRGMRRREVDERAYELLDLLDLKEQTGEMVARFSQGMKQKVALANALIHDPQILVLDEPTLGLDVETAWKIEAVIASMTRQGKGVLLTTHRMRLAERLSHKILVINQGQEVAYDETQDLLNRFNPRAVVEIKIAGVLSGNEIERIADVYPSIMPRHEPQATILTWVEPTQPQLIGLMEMLNRMDRRFVSINQREPSLEEVFLSLTAAAPGMPQNGAFPIAHTS